MKRTLLLAAAGMMSITLAACSSSNPGTSAPTTSSSGSGDTSTSVDGSLAGGVPQVTNPKNIKDLDPCQLLTSAQLAQLGATASPEKGTSGWGEQMCDWRSDSLDLVIEPETTLGNGIYGTYEQESNTPGFKKIQVDGYPAAQTDQQSHSCRIYVGISQTQEFAVDFALLGGTRPDYMDPCGFAEKVAGMVLTNLPAAG